MAEEVTRPPNESDVIALARELNRHGARYIIVGGIAINQLGHARSTEDIDLLIARDRENQARVRKALASLPDQAVNDLGPDEDFADWVVVRVNDEITVDLMTEASGIGYLEAEPQIAWIELQGVRIPFASAELMLRFKEHCHRPKDEEDRAFLRWLAQQRQP